MDRCGGCLCCLDSHFNIIVSGLYFGVTVPVQPMKVIGAYAVATDPTPSQILASSLLMGLFLLIIGLTGAIETIKKHTPHAVIRGGSYPQGRF